MFRTSGVPDRGLRLAALRAWGIGRNVRTARLKRFDGAPIHRAERADSPATINLQDGAETMKSDKPPGASTTTSSLPSVRVLRCFD